MWQKFFELAGCKIVDEVVLEDEPEAGPHFYQRDITTSATKKFNGQFCEREQLQRAADIMLVPLGRTIKNLV